MADGLPQDESAIAKKVIELLAAKLNRPASDIGVDDDLLLDLGIDSLAMAEFTVLIEQQVGTKIRGEELIESQTVGDVVRLLARRSPTAKS